MQRTIKRIKPWGFMMLLAAIWLCASFIAEAAVTLRSFTATSAEDGQSVTIEWETGTEQSAAEFYIYRDQAGQNDPVPTITIDDLDGDSIITINGSNEKATAALGDTSAGASYSVTDENVEEGETYRYVLVELEIEGTVARYPGFASTVTVTEDEGGIGIGDPTATPEPDPTATPEPEETVTEEPTATPTEEPDEEDPTATPQPDEEETPEPTETPNPDDEEETPQPTATPDEEADEDEDNPDPTATPEPTATQEPTATPQPTETPLRQPTATQTPPPTNTPAPTATLVIATAESENNLPAPTEPPNDDAATSQERTEIENEDEQDVVVEDVSAESSETDSITGVGVAEAAEEAYPVGQVPADGDTSTQPVDVDAAPEGSESADIGDTSDSSQQTDLLLDTNSQNAQQIGSTDTVLGDGGSNVIGGSSADTGSLAPPLQAEPDDDGGSSILLWLVFAAGILVFIAGVAGSILIFTRQREDSA